MNQPPNPVTSPAPRAPERIAEELADLDRLLATFGGQGGERRSPKEELRFRQYAHRREQLRAELEASVLWQYWGALGDYCLLTAGAPPPF